MLYFTDLFGNGEELRAMSLEEIIRQRVTGERLEIKIGKTWSGGLTKNGRATHTTKLFAYMNVPGSHESRFHTQMKHSGYALAYQNKREIYVSRIEIYQHVLQLAKLGMAALTGPDNEPDPQKINKLPRPSWDQWRPGSAIFDGKHRNTYGSPTLLHRDGIDDFMVPSDILATVREFYGGSITLDSCSTGTINRLHVKAENFYSISFSGLENEWYGNVFCFPSSSESETKQWCNKLVAESQSKRVKHIIAIFPGIKTGSLYFEETVGKACDVFAICSPRPAFYKPEGTKTNSGNGGTSYVYYFGPNPIGFCSIWKRRHPLHRLCVNVEKATNVIRSVNGSRTGRYPENYASDRRAIPVDGD